MWLVSRFPRMLLLLKVWCPFGFGLDDAITAFDLDERARLATYERACSSGMVFSRCAAFRFEKRVHAHIQVASGRIHASSFSSCLSRGGLEGTEDEDFFDFLRLTF